MMDYCIEVASNLSDLTNQVRTMMGAGYKPVGGITIRESSSSDDYIIQHLVYMQAMTKGENRDE